MTCSGTHTEWKPRSSAAAPRARNESGVVPGVDDGAKSPICTAGRQTGRGKLRISHVLGAPAVGRAHVLDGVETGPLPM